MDSTLSNALDPSHAPIGIFDSGVGGLSVLRAIREQLPGHPVIYLADQAHVPYGSHTKAEVRAFSEGVTRFLLDQGARLVVVACNTASAAALYYLRETFPAVPFVGMEPAVKPAAASTHSGVIGVLATPVTFQGDMYASVVERFGKGVTILQDICYGLVARVEAGDLQGEATRGILEKALQPMLEQGVDTVVMGCTHYPFVIPMIRQIAGPGVQVIDPAPAVARQVGRLLAERGMLARRDSPAEAAFFTTGNPQQFEQMLTRLLGMEQVVQYVQWKSGLLG